jgi:hypothetical protein
MNTCEFESRVLDASFSGVFDADLLSHIEICAQCADLALVVGALGEAATTVDHDPLPDPQRIWLRAQINERRQAARRAVGAIVLVQRIAMALGAALVLMWSPELVAVIRRAAGGIATETASALPAAVASPIAVLAMTALVLVVLTAFNGMGDPAR